MAALKTVLALQRKPDLKRAALCSSQWIWPGSRFKTSLPLATSALASNLRLSKKHKRAWVSLITNLNFSQGWSTRMKTLKSCYLYLPAGKSCLLEPKVASKSCKRTKRFTPCYLSSKNNKVWLKWKQQRSIFSDKNNSLRAKEIITRESREFDYSLRAD